MWLLFASSLLLIVSVGFLSALFDEWLHFCISIFQSHTKLIWLLPILGCLVSYAQERGWLNFTSLVQLLKSHPDASPKTPFWIILFSGFSQLLGASTGREGTSLLYSLELSNWIIHRLKLQPFALFFRRLAVAVGFSSLFLLPLGGLAASFELLPKSESESHRRFLLEFIFVAISSFLAQTFALFLGMKRLDLGILKWSFDQFELNLLKQFILVTFFVFITTRIYIFIYRRCFTKRAISSFLILVAFAGLSHFTQFRWNGLGIELLQSPFANWNDGILKIFATLVSTTSGLKGGEVTPLLVGGFLTGLFFSSMFAQITSIAMFASILGVPLTALAVGYDFFGIYGAVFCGLITFIVYRANFRDGLWRG